MSVRHRSIFLFAAVLLSISMAGCTGLTDESMTQMGSHHVVVKPGRSVTTKTNTTSEKSDYESYEFACGDVVVKIENEALTVNAKPYGTLYPNDSVSVDHGVVSVNGKRRNAVSNEGANPEEKDSDSESSAGGTS